MGYLFPFNSIMDGGKIYIYGAGKIGNDYHKQIEESKRDIAVLGFIESVPTAKESLAEAVRRVGVFSPEVLLRTEYDYVVVSCGYTFVPEILKTLFELDIPFNKILLGIPVLADDLNSPNIEDGWNSYYARAESDAAGQMAKYFAPMKARHEFSLKKVLDFPSGKGRMAAELLSAYDGEIERLVCCDANAEAVGFCENRFAGDVRIEAAQNEVSNWDISKLTFDDESFSLVFSWDAMVHFSYKWLDYYITEFFRIIQPGGFVFLHHSNLASPEVDMVTEKYEQWLLNPGGRANVSRFDIKHIAQKAGFEVVEQCVIDWTKPKLDCISILKK